MFKKSDHESVTMEKCPLTWDNSMVHDVNNPKPHIFHFVIIKSKSNNTIYETDRGFELETRRANYSFVFY